MSEDWMRELFGEVISSYPDAAAIEDGILIPFVVNGRDTHHRITTTAFEALSDHHRPHYPKYQPIDFYKFFFNEFLCLEREARRVYEQNGILTTDYKFTVVKWQLGEILWYIPNEVGGVTAMLPSDY